jgi:hypothetical protein
MIASEIQRFAAAAPLAAGYHFELLQRTEILELVAALTNWFPDISVGGASCYLQTDFYARKAFFDDAPEQDTLVFLLKTDNEIAGMFSFDLDHSTQSIYAGLGVASPSHHGSNLAQAGMAVVEAIGRHLGMGYIFGMATLRHPYAQRAFERAGWELIGVTPGYDRELVAPGVVKRVYEAMYAKVLESDAGVQHPLRDNLTPRTQAYFDAIATKCGADVAYRADSYHSLSAADADVMMPFAMTAGCAQ